MQHTTGHITQNGKQTTKHRKRKPTKHNRGNEQLTTETKNRRVQLKPERRQQNSQNNNKEEEREQHHQYRKTEDCKQYKSGAPTKYKNKI